jgi:type II secretory pathway pseudopilin PulG
MNNSGRTTFEALIVTALAGILLVMAISTFLGSVRLVREVALRAELGNIRTAVSLYLILNRRLPKSLNDMVKERYLLPYQEEGVINRAYLETASVDKDGNPLDPFGNRYIYDEKMGMVKSSTKGYEGW